jgi:hypothetical protein
MRKDIMMAQFNGPQYFRTPEDASFVDTVIIEVTKPVPQQIEKELADKLKRGV